MRPRTLLTGILLLGSIFIATTVSGLPTFKFFVQDSTPLAPQSVGFVISVSTEIDPFSLFNPDITELPRHVLTLLPIPKVAEPQGVDDFWKLGLRVEPDEIAYLGALHFTSTDCTGSGWIADFAIDAEFGSAFDPHVVVGNGIDPDIRALYAADPAAPLSMFMQFNSISRINNGCNVIGTRTIQAKPAILLDANLHQTYPPPYKLQFEFTP